MHFIPNKVKWYDALWIYPTLLLIVMYVSIKERFDKVVK